jgi:hypothetical protein
MIYFIKRRTLFNSGWDKNVAAELVTHMNKKLTCDKSEDLEKDLTINEIKKCNLYSE